MRVRATLGMMSAIFGLVGMLLLVMALFFAYSSWSFTQGAQEAAGEVVALDRTTRGSTRPIVVYKVRGDPYELIGGVSSTPPAFAIGEKVTVLYQKQDPKNARIDSFLEFWFLPALFGGLGGSFALPALVLGIISLVRR